jgi:hypothetical protein
VSESHDDGQPEGSAQPSSSGQPENDKSRGTGGAQPSSGGQPDPGRSRGTGGAQPSSGGQPDPGRSRGPGGGPPSSGGQTGNNRTQSRPNGQRGGGSQSRRVSDPVADFQRWLVRAGARSMANQVADQVKRTLGQERRYSGDVWDTATNEPPPNEPPECQWCPVCQAARAARLSGPGLGARLADAGGVLASVAQDFFSAFDQLMKTQDQNRSSERPGATPPPPESDRGDVAS